MKIAFWNIKLNKNFCYIVELVKRVQADILFLAECPQENITELQNSYKVLAGKIYERPKIYSCIISETLGCSLIQEYKNRLFVYRLTFGKQKLLVGVVHLISKNHANPNTQITVSIDYMREIREAYPKQDMILIGDFNMNPFDHGMVSVAGFNSVCSEEIALKEQRQFQMEKYDYFFNPSWKNYSGIGNEVYGTYYHHSPDSDGFYWNNYDQVLLRPAILKKYNYKFTVLHNILNFDLRRKNNGISDHYPILLELQEK
ncbi:MAG: hypothetical protein LBQ66_06420 [Planctomycetaceae bacterium]|jgi:exonuclease III|nr:hypothetical protein [Planctomycetaceae bacterium]